MIFGQLLASKRKIATKKWRLYQWRP